MQAWPGVCWRKHSGKCCMWAVWKHPEKEISVQLWATCGARGGGSLCHHVWIYSPRGRWGILCIFLLGFGGLLVVGWFWGFFLCYYSFSFHYVSLLCLPWTPRKVLSNDSTWVDDFCWPKGSLITIFFLYFWCCLCKFLSNHTEISMATMILQARDVNRHSKAKAIV